MRTDQIVQTAKEFDIREESAFKMRVRYLQSLLSQWVKFIDDMEGNIPESDMMAIITELITISKYQERESKGVKLDSITDDDIQKARDYPIENLIEFYRGKALCFMHSDKTPSMSYHAKTNTARCFVCDKTVNSIDVLILRDGISFIDAVKHLN